MAYQSVETVPAPKDREFIGYNLPMDTRAIVRWVEADQAYFTTNGNQFPVTHWTEVWTDPKPAAAPTNETTALQQIVAAMEGILSVIDGPDYILRELKARESLSDNPLSRFRKATLAARKVLERRTP